MLVTEGTYPQVHGGVSTWCDQMIRGLAGHRFQVISLTATGREETVWELPDNVLGHTTVPIWNMTPASHRRPRNGADRRDPGLRDLGPRDLGSHALDPHALDPHALGSHEAGPHRSVSSARGWRDSLLRRGARPDPGHAPARALVAAALSRGPDAATEFEAALFELFLLAQRTDLGSVWRSARLVMDTVELWADHQGGQSGQGEQQSPELPLSDAMAALDLIEHALRPLAFRPVQADVTHAVSNGLAALIGLGAKWTHGTPLVLAEHGVYLRERYLALRLEPLGWPVKAILAAFTRRLCEAGYRAADLITPCADFNQRWELRLGADPAKLRTVYNGVDPARFQQAGAEPDVPTLAFVGRIDPLKDLLTLFRAFALVLEQIPQARLRVYGAAPKGGERYHEECLALVAELGLGEAVIFEGQCSAVSEAYAASHVVVLSSISEGFPFSVIEAMVCARPLVATEVGGVAEAIGPTGLVVPPRRPDKFAEACVQLLTDHPRRLALGRAARERALELFSIERAVTAFDQIYRDLAVDPETIGLTLVGSEPVGPTAVSSEPVSSESVDPAPGRAVSVGAASVGSASAGAASVDPGPVELCGVPG
jgi:glycosyltransferase involved in cell wall biosynthesis